MKKWFSLLLAAAMLFSLCACGGAPEEEPAEEPEAVQEDIHEVDAIDLSVEKGSIKFVGVEAANEGLTDEENAYLLKFEYTNHQSKPEQCQSTFYIQCFQNGVEVTGGSSWSSEGGDQYDLCGNFFSEVMKGGTVTFAKLVALGDTSPITILVSDRDAMDDTYQSMEVDLSDLGSAPAAEGKGEAEESSASESSASSYTAIAIGDKIETKDIDFTLENVELTYEVTPPNTNGVYTSYTAESGKVYVHMEGSYYNKTQKDICVRDLFVPSADYNNGYGYQGFAIVEEGDNSFTWSSPYVVCTPLETCAYHGLIECPQEVAETDAPLYITFKIDGTIYRYDIR